MEKLNTSEKEPITGHNTAARKIGNIAINIDNEDNGTDTFMESITFPAKEASDCQLSFSKRILNLEEKGEKISPQEFKKWEDDYAYYFKLATDAIKDEGLSLSNVPDLNKAASGLVKAFPYRLRSKERKLEFEKQLSTTIEAQSGHFFIERDRALRQAILDANLSDEERTSELKIMRQFIPAVEDHLYYKYLTREEINDYPGGYKRYDEHRTTAHNKAIRYLNNLNDLARKYGTKPFTARNFWPSDMCPNEKFQELPLQTIFQCDRNTVEEYYEIVFKSDIHKQNHKIEQDQKYGLL